MDQLTCITTDSGFIKNGGGGGTLSDCLHIFTDM